MAALLSPPDPDLDKAEAFESSLPLTEALPPQLALFFHSLVPWEEHPVVSVTPHEDAKLEKRKQPRGWELLGKIQGGDAGSGRKSLRPQVRSEEVLAHQREAQSRDGRPAQEPALSSSGPARSGWGLPGKAVALT